MCFGEHRLNIILVALFSYPIGEYDLFSLDSLKFGILFKEGANKEL